MTDDTRTEPPAAAASDLAPADLERLYHYMMLQRLAEERVVKLYQTGQIVGACFTGWGHEAVAVGAAAALGPDDVAATLHRDLVGRLVLGMPPGFYLPYLLGRPGPPMCGCARP